MEHLNLHSNFPLLQRRSWFEKLIWCKRFLETSSSSSKSNEDFPSRVLPIMVFAYMLAFLDKQALGYTALMGIREDLHLVGSQYNWSSSIFYFGYLFFSWVVLSLEKPSYLPRIRYPASLLMVKFPLGKYLATSLYVTRFFPILSVPFLTWLKHALGHRPGLPCCMHKLQGDYDSPVLPWMYRGQPFTRFHSDHIAVVPNIRAATSSWYLVLWKLDFSHIWQFDCRRHPTN